MSVFQIIAVSILGAGALVALGFLTAFIVVSVKKDKKVEETVVPKQTEEVSEIDLDAMLAQLEEASKKSSEEPVKEPKEEKAPVVQEELVQEVKVEPAQEVVMEEVVAEEVVEPVKEETLVVEETAVEPEPIVEEVIEEEPAKEPVKEVVFVKEEVEPVKAETAKAEPEVIVITEKVGPEFDYRIRLEKIKESQVRIDRDLEKTTRAIMKYERTIRRKERNQKMLDRRALELTNLNLLMYSVTDIKNVDAEKKARQEELTAHIAELKASIQDAENYLETNKEKHENNLKLRDYLSHEKTRYADEVKELEALIASGKYFDDNADGENN